MPFTGNTVKAERSGISRKEGVWNSRQGENENESQA